jgi:hypothetical protein
MIGIRNLQDPPSARPDGRLNSYVHLTPRSSAVPSVPRMESHDHSRPKISQPSSASLDRVPFDVEFVASISSQCNVPAVEEAVPPSWKYPVYSDNTAFELRDLVWTLLIGKTVGIPEVCP